MNQKELKELIDYLIEKDISEFELERGDVKVRIKRGSTDAHVAPTASLPVNPTGLPVHAAVVPDPVRGGAAPVPAPAVAENLHIIKSPIVGTFYECPGPGAPPFVKVGDVVEAGQVMCIIEAMKLMNEIETDVAGEIVKKFVSNNQPVEYGQELFAIKLRT
jgi:acetyl-CoA carboxylase biotin carboxyl carrier protein